MPVKHIFLAILVAAIWGANFVFVKLGVHEIPPLFLCAVRFFLASIPAIFFIRWPAASFKMVTLYGLCMFTLQFSCIFSGIAAGVPAGMASLLAQTSVFFSIFFAAIFMRDMPTIWQLLGALLSFTGIAYAAMHINGEMTFTGFLLIMIAAVALGFGTVIAKKIGKVNALSLVAWGSLISCPPLLLLSYFIEGPAQISQAVHHLSFVAVIALLYITYISTWAGYGLWSWLLGRYAVAAVVPFTLLVPVFAMLGSTLFMDEQFERWKMIVAGLVITGLCVNFLMPHFIAKRKNKVLNPAPEVVT